MSIVNSSLKPGAVGSINFRFPCIYLQTACISDPSLDLILITKDLISFMKFSKSTRMKEVKHCCSVSPSMCGCQVRKAPGQFLCLINWLAI